MKTSTDNPLARMAKGPRRPIDFTRRNVKLRIFGLLAALMLVLAFAERARDPKFWKWLWEFDPSAASQETVTNRLMPPPLRTHGDPEGTFVSSPADPDSKPAEPAALPIGELDPVERAWDQGWKDVYNRLEPDQRTLLYELLHAGEHHQALPTTKADAAASLLETATALWEDYQAAAFQSVVTLPAADQSQWVDVLRQVNQRWNEDLRPSLQAVIDGRTPTEHEERALASLQKTLDALTLSRIEDDTIFLRPAEREIWLRLEGRMQDAQPDELRRQSVGQVGYLQMFKQPDEYRGKVVTIRGTVKHAYRVPAPDNYLGVKEHIIYWIMPDGGPASPIVVYALGVPEGFPKIQDRSEDGTMTKMHEGVVITGIFLKRGAYLGKDATYTAPLVIAGTPEWIRDSLTLESSSRFSLGGPAWLWPTIGSAALIAALVFGLIYWRIRRSEAEARAIVTAGLNANAPKMSDLTVTPSTAETLRQMELDAQQRSE